VVGAGTGQTTRLRRVGGAARNGATGKPDAVRLAIMAAGAAKYSWFGPAVVARTVADGPFGQAQYGQDRSADEAIVRLTGLATLIASWASTVLDAE